MSTIKVFSGNCQLCDIGVPVGANASGGEPLHTGDIVMLYAKMYGGTEQEQWTCQSPLTVVVSDQYQSYTSGAVEENANPPFYVMGIASCGFGSDEWRISLIKKHSDVIDGEHWPDWGFRYAKVSEAL